MPFECILGLYLRLQYLPTRNLVIQLFQESQTPFGAHFRAISESSELTSGKCSTQLSLYI